jgi:beta-xylosidase
LYEGPNLEREEIGIQVHIHHEEMDEIVEHLRDLGVGWVKVQVSWKLYQSAPDQYTEDRLAELDRLVDGARANDIDVLLNVAKAPEWSRTTTELDGPPTDYALFQEFMAFLAGRYKGRVAAYELWNEPNLQREWNGSPLSAADFVRLMEAGAAGVRSADPEALLISGAPATSTGYGRAQPQQPPQLLLRRYPGRLCRLIGRIRGRESAVGDGIRLGNFRRDRE